MEPVQTDALAPERAPTPRRSRPLALIAGAVLSGALLLGGAASVFAASPAASPSAAPSASTGPGSHDGSGTPAHNCPERSQSSSSDSLSSSS